MNSKALTVFNFEQQEVRTAIGESGEPMFVATDVCRILELVNSRQAVESLDEDEKGVCNVYTLGGQQTMNCVNESGLYHLIFTSRKEKAKKFRRWVTEDVLPSIRKTGRYSLPKQQRLPGTRLLKPPAAGYYVTVDRLPITHEQEQEAVLKYVCHVWDLYGCAVTANVVRTSYFKRLSRHQVQAHLNELSDRGKIEKFRTVHAPYGKFKPVKGVTP